jgi:hypothetical protein
MGHTGFNLCTGPTEPVMNHSSPLLTGSDSATSRCPGVTPAASAALPMATPAAKDSSKVAQKNLL